MYLIRRIMSLACHKRASLGVYLMRCASHGRAFHGRAPHGHASHGRVSRASQRLSDFSIAVSKVANPARTTPPNGRVHGILCRERLKSRYFSGTWSEAEAPSATELSAVHETALCRPPFDEKQRH